MAQVDVLGYLKYNSVVHSWILDLGAWLSSIEISMGDTVPGTDDTPGEVIRDINGSLKSHGIEYTVPDFTRDEHLDSRTVLSDILDLVEKMDRTLGAFLLIGAAAYFLDMAVVTRSPETAIEFRNRARHRIGNIWRRDEGINVNAAALYKLLAEPPHGDLELRTKMKRASQPLVILFLAADPRDAVRRRLLDEKRSLVDIVKSGIIHDAFTVRDVHGCRIDDITEALLRHTPTLLHFSGHGTPEGYHFQDESGKAAIVKPKAFADLLALAHKKGLKGAVMNAGYSDTDAQLLADATGYAVAMKGPLSDRDANTFTRQFYRALGSGETIEEAFDWAVAGAGIDPRTSELHPQLFKQHSAPRGA